jgi:hypothetical protein
VTATNDLILSGQRASLYNEGKDSPLWVGIERADNALIIPPRSCVQSYRSRFVFGNARFESRPNYKTTIDVTAAHDSVVG